MVCVGIGYFGLISFVSGLMCNVNLIWFNECFFWIDLEICFVWLICFVNDVDCFVFFEVIDGVGCGFEMVVGVIIGIGVGGGLVMSGKLYDGL